MSQNELFSHRTPVLTTLIRGREPLTARDVAETVVFVASRRQNSVIADMLILPKHQASSPLSLRQPYMLMVHSTGIWIIEPETLMGVDLSKIQVMNG